MTTIILGLALIITVCAVALAILRAGIHRQERACCLSCQPPGRVVALTRRLAGLSVRNSPRGACHAAHICRSEDDSPRVPGDEPAAWR